MDLQHIEHLKISELFASPWNRAADGNGELKELAESIKLHGILQPIIVREGNEIVAGHRRWHAAKLAGLDSVPCVLVKLSDQDAKVAQIVENLHRKNLNPIEEAKSFQNLMDEKVLLPQDVAQMAGKNTNYVYRSLQLLSLPPSAIKALSEGRLTAAHGHQLARVGPAQVETVVKYALEPDWHKNLPTVQDLKDFIAQRAEKQLSRAPFKLDVPYAGKIACVNCPYNTGNQEVLFDEAKEGRCTNGACFTAKCNQVVKDLREDGAKKFPGVKFLGAARAGYGGNSTVIKGHVVVEVNPKIKAALAKNPEKFGFGIVKPNESFGAGGKIYRVALAVSDSSLSGSKRDRDNGGYVRDPHQEIMWEFIRKSMKEALAKERAIYDKASERWYAVEEKARKAAGKEWAKNKKTIIAEAEKLEAIAAEEKKEVKS